MAIKVDIDKLLEDYKDGGHKTEFINSLKKVLQFASKDKNLNCKNRKRLFIRKMGKRLCLWKSRC